MRTLAQSIPMRGRTTWVSDSGLTSLFMDVAAFDFHYDSTPGDVLALAEVDQLLAYLPYIGLEPMDADECEPTLLADGVTLRHYLVPIIPMDYEVIGAIGADAQVPA